VQFVIKTEDVEDIMWLDELMTTIPEYSKIILVEGNSDYTTLQFGNAYAHLQRNTLYVKIDDDIVYIAKNTIRSLIRTKLSHPEYVVVSANVINSPLISWLHYHQGAVHPFLPELAPPATPPSPKEWRVSQLPEWTGPANFTMTLDTLPPFPGHRWLPLLKGQSTDTTPISLAEYNPHGAGWNHWALAAQQHYSLFQNLETDPQLGAYQFELWDTIYDRLSINFVVFMGDDLLDNGPVPDGDEEYLTSILPKKLGRHVAIDGHAIVAHYSFGPQTFDGPAGLGWTDVLTRYKAYADENVCLTGDWYRR